MTSVEFPRIHPMGELEIVAPILEESKNFLPPVVTMDTAVNRPSPPWKKDSFVPLRLGPIDKAKTYMDSMKQSPHYTKEARSRSAAALGGVTLKYPRIIVRDVQGRTLDTFTTLQEAIYRASWTRKKKGEWPKTQLEWRLPKAPVPSKPDFTRAGPRSMTSLAFNSSRLRREPMTSLSDNAAMGGVLGNATAGTQINLTADVLVNVPTLEIPVDDVSFIAQSLQHLPNLPSFSFLRHSLLAGQSTYVQIVASILLHQRHLRAIDTRENDWEFPGFCTGCKRSGFCYGCSKSSKPHVHEDIPARTGGGFRFWKPDRPRDPHSWKNPNNWKLPSTEQDLQEVIRKYGGLAAYEKAVIAARREMVTSEYEALSELMSQEGVSRGRRLERITTLGSYPPHVTIVSTDKYYDDELIDDSALGEEVRTRDGDADLEDKSEDDARLREMLLRRVERRRDRSRSHESISRRRRIGVTSYKEDSASMTSQTLSARNASVTSEGSVRIDTGLGDELEEGEPVTDDQGGDEEEPREGRRRVRISVADNRGQSEDGTRGREVTRLSTSTRTQSGSVGRKISQASSVSRKTSRLSFKDETKEIEENEEARRRKQTALESIPFARKRKETLYKAPKFFVVQKKTRRIAAGKDPFSTDRDLNLPKGPAFQLKKADRKQTKFIDFKRGDRTWKAPKAFEVKKTDTKHTKFWSGVVKKDKDDDKKKRRGQSKEGRLRRSKTDASTDSGVPNDGTDVDDTLAGQLDDGQDDGAGMDTDGQGTDDLQGQGTGDGAGDGMDDGSKEDRKPKRREIVKKTRVERQRPETPKSPPRLPSPPPFERRKTLTPSPSPSPSPAPPTPEVPLPDIELPTIPDLPTIGEKEPQARKQKMKFAVEAPPPLKEVKKKRRPPPKVRIIPKNMYKHRKTRPAEAPVTQEELMDIQDPLDFLAKYCIINPDRLPFYEIVFESTVAEQDPIYTKDKENKDSLDSDKDLENDEDGGRKKKSKSKKKKSSKEKEEKSLDDVIKPDLLPANRGMDLSKSVMTVEEQHLEKLIYTLDLLHDKMDSYSTQLAHLEDSRTRLLAARAKEMFPEVTAPEYVPKTKKKGKKGKKSKASLEPPVKLRPDQITDDVIVSRLDDKMLTELYHDADIHNVNIEMNRLREKIMDVQTRVEEIASEKLLADAFCMNHFFLRQGLSNNNNNNNNKAMTAEEAFRRQQSELYNRLHPNPDFEMNMEEVEGALQQINNHLLTEKEFAFLYNVLNLPRRTKINFRLFSIIAALSEKVTQLDPVIKHLMNNFNYNALDIKMEKCKELFDLLEANDMPRGGAQASSLAVELTAGGLRPENIRHVLHKFNREDRGVVDFLDFVTYVPLFVEIHKRIISDPLRQESDL